MDRGWVVCRAMAAHELGPERSLACRIAVRNRPLLVEENQPRRAGRVDAHPDPMTRLRVAQLEQHVLLGRPEGHAPTRVRRVRRAHLVFDQDPGAANRRRHNRSKGGLGVRG